MNRSYYTRGRTIYRMRDGMILGVCAGLATHFDFSVKVIRIIAVVLVLFTGFWPMVIIYLIAAYFMKPEPIIPMEPSFDAGPHYSHATSRAAAVSHLKNRFDRLSHRVERMEGMVTEKEYNWEQRLNADKA